jgi:hypothetical protein
MIESNLTQQKVHDVNNWLCALSGYTELLMASDNLTEKQMSQLKNMFELVGKVSKTIELSYVKTIIIEASNEINTKIL